MYTSTIIANNIKKRTKETSLSLQALWEKCDMGKNSLSHMKNGSMPGGDKLGRIADCLDCSVDYLLGRDSRTTNNTVTGGNGIVIGQTTKWTAESRSRLCSICTDWRKKNEKDS